MTYTREDMVEFGRFCGRAGIPIGPAMKILRYAATLRTLAERACNYGLTDKDRARDDRTTAAVQALCAEYGVSSEAQGDPRGAILLLWRDADKYDSSFCRFAL
jgi:hypothetical protein